MNKKMLAAIGFSGVLLLGGVYSISANTSGYELYKSALKQTHSADSATMEVSFQLEDNDQSLFKADSLMKADVKQQISFISTNLENESEKSSMNMYKQDGAWYITKEDTGVFYKMDTSKSPHGKGGAKLQKDLENVIDVLTKNLQKQITVDEIKNGGQTIELDLTGKEVPLAANALSSLMIKHAVQMQDRSGEEEGSEFHIKPTLPELNRDITVKSVNISANVNKESYIDQQTVRAVINGKDKSGLEHEIVLTIELDVYDYNNTSVSKTDIPEEKIEILEMKHGGHGM